MWEEFSKLNDQRKIYNLKNLLNNPKKGNEPAENIEFCNLSVEEFKKLVDVIRQLSQAKPGDAKILISKIIEAFYGDEIGIRRRKNQIKEFLAF
jgi:hypothetical protein